MHASALSSSSHAQWPAGPLGSPASWPASLRVAADIVLASPWPMVLVWGAQHIPVYNAAYAALAGLPAAPGAMLPGAPIAPQRAAAAAYAAARAGEHAVASAVEALFPGAPPLDLHFTPLAAGEGVLCSLAASLAAPAAEPDAAAGLRILVVEDNLDAQYLACEMLRAFGHEPDGAGHAEAALDFLATRRYDVLFSDLSLPGMSGIELARVALKQQPALRVIFASGYGDSLLRHVEFAHQSMQKPYDLEQLQTKLAAIQTSLGR